MRLQATEAELIALRQSVAAPQVSCLEAMTAQILVQHNAPELSPGQLSCTSTLHAMLSDIAATCLAYITENIWFA